MAGLPLTCPQCKYDLTVGPANTVLILVKKHEYMSYIHVTCPRPQCSHYWLSFLDAFDPAHVRQLVKAIRQARCRVTTQTPTPETIRDYELVAGVTLLQPIALSTRQEAQISALAWELEGVVTVQDILDVDIEHRLPKQWI